jgi:hypothetical protein
MNHRQSKKKKRSLSSTHALLHHFGMQVSSLLLIKFQMALYLAEASRYFACTDLFREPSKYAWSDCYEDHFILPNQRRAIHSGGAFAATAVRWGSWIRQKAKEMVPQSLQEVNKGVDQAEWRIPL